MGSKSDLIHRIFKRAAGRIEAETYVSSPLASGLDMILINPSQSAQVHRPKKLFVPVSKGEGLKHNADCPLHRSNAGEFIWILVLVCLCAVKRLGLYVRRDEGLEGCGVNSQPYLWILDAQ